MSASSVVTPSAAKDPRRTIASGFRTVEEPGADLRARGEKVYRK